MNPGLKKTLLLIVKLGISGLLVYYVMKKAGIEKVTGLLLNIDKRLFALSIAFFLVQQFIAAIRWGILLPEKHSLRRLYPLYLLGAFFNIFMPGLVGGDVMKIYYLYKETGKGTQALSSVFMDRYVGLFTLMLLGLLAFPFGLQYLTDPRIRWLLPMVVGGFIVGSVLFFSLRLGRNIKVLGDIYDNLYAYRARKADIAKATGLSIISHAIGFSSVYMLALGLGQHIPLLLMFIFVPIIATISAVIPSISGLGVRELTTVMLFGTVGVAGDTATAISFAWYLSIVIGGLTGLYEFITNKATVPVKGAGTVGDSG